MPFVAPEEAASKSDELPTVMSLSGQVALWEKGAALVLLHQLGSFAIKLFRNESNSVYESTMLDQLQQHYPQFS